jgi:hypothetical protein
MQAGEYCVLKIVGRLDTAVTLIINRPGQHMIFKKD